MQFECVRKRKIDYQGMETFWFKFLIKIVDI